MSPLEIYLVGAVMVALGMLATDSKDLILALWAGLWWPLWTAAIAGIVLLGVVAVMLGAVGLAWRKVLYIRGVAQRRPHSKRDKGYHGHRKNQ